MSTSIDIFYTSLCIIFNWYFFYNWYFLLISKCTFQLVSNVQYVSIGIYWSIYFNWYPWKFILVSKYKILTFIGIKISIGKMFQLQLKFKICNDYLQLVYLKICFIKKIQNLVLIRNIKNVFMYIAYMQGELNISSTYRFMLSVSFIEELDNSSLCGTRV